MSSLCSGTGAQGFKVEGKKERERWEPWETVTLTADEQPWEHDSIQGSSPGEVRPGWSCAAVVQLLSPVRLRATLWTLPTRLFCSGDFPGKNTGLDRHSLFQGIFPTQGLNPRLPPCQRILYSWATREKCRLHLQLEFPTESCPSTFTTKKFSHHSLGVLNHFWLRGQKWCDVGIFWGRVERISYCLPLVWKGFWLNIQEFC